MIRSSLPLGSWHSNVTNLKQRGAFEEEKRAFEEDTRAFEQEKQQFEAARRTFESQQQALAQTLVDERVHLTAEIKAFDEAQYLILH